MQERRKLDINLIKTVTKESVRETLTAIGFDMDDPIEVQQDVAWLRSARKNSKRVGEGAVNASIATVVGGILWSIWLAIKGNG